METCIVNSELRSYLVGKRHHIQMFSYQRAASELLSLMWAMLVFGASCGPIYRADTLERDLTLPLATAIAAFVPLFNALYDAARRIWLIYRYRKLMFELDFTSRGCTT